MLLLNEKVKILSDISDEKVFKSATTTGNQNWATKQGIIMIPEAVSFYDFRCYIAYQSNWRKLVNDSGWE